MHIGQRARAAVRLAVQERELEFQHLHFAALGQPLAGSWDAFAPHEYAGIAVGFHVPLLHVFEEIPELNALMRSLNVRTINVCNNGKDEHLETMHAIALEQYHRDPDLYPFTSTFDLRRRNEPTYTQEVIAHLDRTFEQGAVGVKIWKEIGIDIKDRNGKFILPDDPLFDPIYAHIAKRGKVLHAHLAEPIDAWLPLDRNSAHYPDRILYGVDASWKLFLRPSQRNEAQRKGLINRLRLQYKADYDYYAGSGEMTYNNRKVQSLNLPRGVLEKFYHENAERLFKLEKAWAPSVAK